MKFFVPSIDEVEIAFSKLQSYNYFDNYDLILREKIALYKKESINLKLRNFCREFNKEKPFDKALRMIKLIALPKKVKSEPGLPANFYTNSRVIDGNEIEKAFLFCDMPVNLHLVATIWILRYGAYLESKISDNAQGNRLLLKKNKNQVAEGRTLFKRYFRQFQSWWSSGIEKAKELLAKGENVTILNFDLQSFYHNVQFDFAELEGVLLEKFPSIKKDPIHQLLVEIHLAYKEKISAVNDKLKHSRRESKTPLPIGVFTSHLFANWYLSKLDVFIETEINPAYYGRYVDDILIVVKDTVYEKEDVGAEGKNKDFLVEKYIKQYFDSLFEMKNQFGGETAKSLFSLKIRGLENLVLNPEKLFIYQFNANYSPNIIDSFVEEQKERVSMFRFLSDEEDEYFGDFDAETFESNFDHIEGNKARFKNVEDNKYKLSVFFSKLIKRRVYKGEGYRNSDIDKISRYFKSTYLIKNYLFWEKLLTLYVVYKRLDKLIELIDEISIEIDSVKVLTSDPTEFSISAQLYKDSLWLHLRSALKLSLGLNLPMISESDVLQNRLFRVLYVSRSTRRISKYDREALIEDFRLFKKGGLLRGAFVYYPLIQFTDIVYNYDFNLTESSLLELIFKNSNSDNGDDTSLQISKRIRKEFIPFRVKYWQVALLTYYNNLFSHRIVSSKPNPWLTDKFSNHRVLDQAFDLFYDINTPSARKTTLKKEYFEQQLTEKGRKLYSDRVKRIPSDRSKNYFTRGMYLKNGGKKRNVFRVGIVNKYVDLKDFEASLDGQPILTPERVEVFEQIWDEVSKIPECDLFVMPELALPHRMIHSYVDRSARNQVGFISGIEHLNFFKVGFNFILTALPIVVEGDRDVIPILRLKNHYAPDEEEWIKKKNMLVPKPNPYRYDLFAWRGVYFASYYCFELADVFHRSIFFSKVDAVFAPIWNIDTHYYNSIIDAATRDMHNYYIIVNTSQYGFSKISRPRDFVNKEKVLLKGGTDDQYPFTIAIGDLNIEELRAFQQLDFNEQKQKNKDEKKTVFKPSPPDFPKENVLIRVRNEKFKDVD